MLGKEQKEEVTLNPCTGALKTPVGKSYRRQGRRVKEKYIKMENKRRKEDVG
jgi:hypothetical protein